MAEARNIVDQDNMKAWSCKKIWILDTNRKRTPFTCCTIRKTNLF